MNRNWVPLLLLGLSLVAPVGAVDGEKPPEEASNRGTDKQVAKLASEFKVAESQVKDLRAKGLGWGEVRHALAISRKAGVPVEDVMKLRDSGLGWGKIAQNYGFKLGEATGRPREQAGEVRRDGGDRVRPDRKDRETGPGHRGRGEHPGHERGSMRGGPHGHGRGRS